MTAEWDGTLRGLLQENRLEGEKENCEAIQIQMKGEKSKEKLDDVWEKVKENIYLRQVCQHAEQRMGKKWKEETILNVCTWNEVSENNFYATHLFTRN